MKTVSIMKVANSLRREVWILIMLLSAICFGIAIANEKWIYLGLLLSPLLIYISIEKPFIFPFGLYVMLLPFDSILSLTGSEGSTFTKFLGVLSILVLFLKGIFDHKFKRPDAAIVWWLLFVTYSILSLFWAIDASRVLSVTPTTIGLFILYFIAASYKISDDEFTTLKYFLLLSGLVSSLFVIYNYSQLFLSGDMVRATMSMGSQVSDQNRFAFSLIIPLSLCVHMMITNNKKLLKIIYGITLCVIIYCIVITGSRGGFLGVLTVLMTYILFSKKRIAYSIPIALIAIIIIYLLPNLFFERWDEAVDTGGSGRLDIWSVGLIAIKKYWLYGAGFNNYPNAYNEFIDFAAFSISQKNRAAHNLGLATFVELGFIGMAFMLMAIIKHYQLLKIKSSYVHPDAIMLKASFWGVLMSSFFLDVIWLKSFWLLWILIAIYSNVVNYKDNGKNKLSSSLTCHYPAEI